MFGFRKENTQKITAKIKLIGILSGLLIAYYFYRSFYDLEVPVYLSFIAGMLVIILLLYFAFNTLKQDDFVSAIPYIVFFIALLSSSVAASYFTEIREGRKYYSFSRSQAESIINKIESYKSNHNKFPHGLEALAPDYFETIPKTADSLDYVYYPYLDPSLRVFIGDSIYSEGYTLEYKIRPYGICTYNSFEKKWRFDS